MTDKHVQLVVFNLDERAYALYLSAVERVVRAVEVTPFPKAPDIVAGAVNVRGRIIPLLNIRRRFHLPEREMDLSDQLIISKTSNRTVALAADSVNGVFVRPAEAVTEKDRIVPGLEYVEGVIKLKDGLVLIHDLDTFLSIEEKAGLDAVINNRQE